MRSLEMLREALASVLEQGVAMLDAIDDDAFRATDPISGIASVGAHLRHAGDAVDRLLHAAGDVVDYDRRDRDPAFEIDRAAARARFVRLAMASRRALGVAAAEQSLRVNLDSPLGDAPLFSASSLARELQFVASHCVHHYAMIAVRLRLLGITPPSEFGIAPSTLLHEKGRSACAP